MFFGVFVVRRLECFEPHRNAVCKAVACYECPSSGSDKGRTLATSGGPRQLGGEPVILGLFQIDKNLRSLERCQSLEETQRLYEAGDHRAVVRLLRPTLCPSGLDRAKHLEFMTSVPERPAQLLLLQVRAPPRPCPLFPLREAEQSPPLGSGPRWSGGGGEACCWGQGNPRLWL